MVDLQNFSQLWSKKLKIKKVGVIVDTGSYHVMTRFLLFQKVDSSGGPFFKVVLGSILAIRKPSKCILRGVGVLLEHTKNLKEIPSRHVLKNLPEKASMYDFIHLKLISNLQGFCQYIMAYMLNLTIAYYRKYSGVAFLGP